MRVRAIIPAALVLAGMTAIPVPQAGAEVNWPDLILSGYAGTASLDDSYGVDGGIPFGARAGFTFSHYFGLEGHYGKTRGDREVASRRNYPLDQLGVDLILHGFPDSRFNPYLLLGWAQLNLDEAGDHITRMNGTEFGGGVKLRLFRSEASRLDLRLDARNVSATNDDPVPRAGETRSHFFLTAGLSLTLANPERDSDADGVLDKFDRCPDTIPGAEVDPFGCALDYDQDGVPDGLDGCPSTPRGAIVDAAGCPSDSDEDGVMDGIDLCDESLPGVVVDAVGCAKDSDGDGVFDGIDRCPGTPARILVDEYGCPLTPTVTATATELQLLDTGSLVMNNVYFESGRWTLKPESHPPLDEVGAVLVKWPELRVEVGGHTDDGGAAEANRELSEKRATAVIEYLAGRFPELVRGRFQAVGYGESNPIDSNRTPAGRARNRRVELKVLNPGVITRER